jgi:hypothetical protein
VKPGYSDRLYALLLRLLPFDFRSEFGGDMEETFRAQREEAERIPGLRALLRMWWATIVDIVAMAPREALERAAPGRALYAAHDAQEHQLYGCGGGDSGFGISVNTSIFSMVSAGLLQPLPFLQGDRLIGAAPDGGQSRPRRYEVFRPGDCRLPAAQPHVERPGGVSLHELHGLWRHCCDRV